MVVSRPGPSSTDNGCTVRLEQVSLASQEQVETVQHAWGDNSCGHHGFFVASRNSLFHVECPVVLSSKIVQMESGLFR